MYVEKNDRKTMISEKTKHTSCILKRNFINVGSKITKSAKNVNILTQIQPVE